MGIRADSEDDEIPKHQDQVHGQEKPEEEMGIGLYVKS